MKYFKTVLMPIRVPVGDCCFGGGRCCGSFDNEGGCSSCDRGFFPLERDKEG